MLFSKLLPREGNFFELFNRHADEMYQAALSFSQLVSEYDNVEARERLTAEIAEIEHKADRITAEVLRLLHKTFITPIDREQIHSMTIGIDDVVDTIQHVAQAMSLYDVHAMTPEIVSMTDLSMKACVCLKNAAQPLKQLNKEDVVKVVIQACQEIDKLESEADKAQSVAISALFRKEPDVRELIKYNAIYSQLEQITDRCEDVADIIEGIVLENS